MVHFDIPFEGPITNGSKLPLIDLFDLFLFLSVIEGHIMHLIFSSMMGGGGGLKNVMPIPFQQAFCFSKHHPYFSVLPIMHEKNQNKSLHLVKPMVSTFYPTFHI